MSITSLRNDTTRRVLELGLDNGATAAISHAALRAGCRCSGCTAARRAGDAPLPATGVALEQITPVGMYGVQLIFNDGHDRGIYPWQMLLELIETQAEIQARQAA